MERNIEAARAGSELEEGVIAGSVAAIRAARMPGRDDLPW